MEMFRNRSSFLLTQFREFYRELVRLRRSIAYAGTARAPAGPADRVSLAPAEGRGSVLSIWQPLVSLLERQALEAGEMGGSFAFEIYREAQYVMCALADEIFLHEDWDGRENWQLLEGRLFETHYAGEEVFNRIDRLLQRNDSFYVDLASVYFQALSIGFEGKYRGSQSNQPAVYRQQLFSMIYRRNPKLFSAGAPLFPQAYQNVMESVTVKMLPAHWMNLWLAAGVVVLWLIGSQYAWGGATNSISCLMCSLLGRGCVCQVGPGASPAPARAAVPGDYAGPSKQGK